MPEPLVERTPRTWVTRAPIARLDEAIETIATAGGGDMRWWTSEPGAEEEAVASAHGLHRERTLYQLRVALPVNASTPAIALRSFVPGHDEGEWLAVNNRAFADHPEQGGWTREMVAAREREPWFDPKGFLLHHDSGRLAGFVWTKVHGPTAVDPALGEIFVIAVDPDFVGRGLGRALTVAGLDWLHRERGIDNGMLYVDAANEPAVKLYFSIGFTVHAVDVAYFGDVAGAGAV